MTTQQREDALKKWAIGVAGTLVAALLAGLIFFFATLPRDVQANSSAIEAVGAAATVNSKRIEETQSGMERALAELKAEQKEQRNLLIEILRETKK